MCNLKTEKQPLENIVDIVHDSQMDEYFKRDSEMVQKKIQVGNNYHHIRVVHVRIKGRKHQ